MTKPKAKVLIIVENLPVPLDRRVWMEATSLTRAGYSVSVICPRTQQFPAAFEMREGVAIYRHYLPEGKGLFGYLREYSVALFQQFRLALQIKLTRGFDIIHACNPPDLIFLVALFFKLFFRTRFLFDQHDLCPELFEIKFGRHFPLYHLLRACEALTYRLADAVISTNESFREVAQKRGGKLRKQVFVVRSGPDTKRFAIRAPKPEYKRGKRFLVAYIGVMGKQDGVDFLIRAAHHLIQARGRRDIQFMLMGSGPELPHLQGLAKELRVDDSVEFAGWVLDDELLDRLSTADIGVCPDPANPLNDKSTMNKIIEYMALGKPVVQFDLTEGRRSAEDASLYARPNEITDLADKIAIVLDSPELRKRLSERGIERVRTVLEWKFQEQELWRAYQFLLTRS